MTDEPTLPEHVAANRGAWDEWAPEYAAAGRREWEAVNPTWGTWAIPESAVRMLDDVAGKDVIELGCGTAYVSSWLARRGARVVGIDNSPKQLETARSLQAEHGLDFPLLLGNAESVPYPDASFDLAISEYGACLWADPYAWIPEAARLLRPGGELRFLTNGVLLVLTEPALESEGPATDRMLRPLFGMHRYEWEDSPGIDFHLPHGEWIRLLRKNGFDVLELLELRPPEGATTTYGAVTLEWARQWPSEEVWKARKRV